MKRKTKNKKPMLLATIGTPGSGKSYLAKNICDDFGFFHLASDHVRDGLFKKPKYSKEENSRIFGLMDFFTDALLAGGRSVVYDANSQMRDYRKNIRNIAKKHGASYCTLWIQAPIELAVKRAASREYHPVDALVVLGIEKEFEPPTKREPHLILDGTKPYRAQRKLIAQHIRKTRS